MARNGSGTMSIVNSFSANTTIESSAMNANFTDIASEITNSLPRDGQAAMTGQFKAASGTSTTPSISFGSDTDTGFYRKSANTIGVVAGGVEVGTLSSSGLTDSNSFVVTGIPPGAMMMYGATSAPAGWVRCNGRTIGNGSSGATERANADTASLFAFLWNNYSNTVCAVSGGRGSSATDDYAANKTIALPDLRGRAFFGLDDMGNSAASRLGSVITGQTTNGSSGGTETHTLSAAELPVITPAGTVAITPNPHKHAGGGTNSSKIVQSGSGVAVVDNSGTPDTNDTSLTATFTGTSFGSGQAHSNMPPAFLTTFIIKL